MCIYHLTDEFFIRIKNNNNNKVHFFVFLHFIDLLLPLFLSLLTNCFAFTLDFVILHSNGNSSVSQFTAYESVFSLNLLLFILFFVEKRLNFNLIFLKIDSIGMYCSEIYTKKQRKYMHSMNEFNNE